MSAEVFALLVFYSDEYVSFVEGDGELLNRTRRFFGLARRLPLELQMTLCNVTCGLGRPIIAKSLSEAAFKRMLWKLVAWPTET